MDMLVAGVGTASLQACRKWLPKVAQPSQKSPVKVQFPTSTTISTRSSIASWPPWSCVGALMTPKSGPSLLLSMLPGASTKSCAMSQLTSEDWRLLTKLLPHSDFGVGHCPSLPAAQLGQKFEPADHSQVTSGPSVTPLQSSRPRGRSVLPAATLALSSGLSIGAAPAKLREVRMLFDGSAASLIADVLVITIFRSDGEMHVKLAVAA